MTNDETKLPKWAQRRLTTLRMRLEEANAKLSGGSDGARIFSDPYSDVPIPLSDSAVEFRFDEDPADRRLYVTTRLMDGGLQITSSDHLLVEPQSGNVVTVRVSRR